ncbi:MAG: hypothetical protein KJ709_03455 [Nanoarchaeota archaeon]|nr:hypothetical protein [Nanoarchaeota archaeon]
MKKPFKFTTLAVLVLLACIAFVSSGTDGTEATITSKIEAQIELFNSPPHALDIPNLHMKTGRSKTIDLNDYVMDKDDAPSEISWTATSSENIMVTIGEDNVATVYATQDFSMNGSVLFTATDPNRLSDSTTLTVKEIMLPPSFAGLPENDQSSPYQPEQLESQGLRSTYQHNIPLVEGWNLISLPLIPLDDDLEAVLESIDGYYQEVWYYDAISQGWLSYDVERPDEFNTLKRINERMGFWIYVTSDAMLVVDGYQVAYTAFVVKEGWNMIGYPTEIMQAVRDAFDMGDDTYDEVWLYDAGDVADHWKSFDYDRPDFWNDLSEMMPGHGYWVYVMQDMIWDFENDRYSICVDDCDPDYNMVVCEAMYRGCEESCFTGWKHFDYGFVDGNYNWGCCGDDEFERYVDQSCAESSGAECSDDPGESACCDVSDNVLHPGTGERQDDCTDGNDCFSPTQIFDVDNDGHIEDCWVGSWQDPDMDRIQCSFFAGECTEEEYWSYFDGNDGDCPDSRKWEQGGEQHPFGEYDTGTSTGCCGDDDGEFPKWEGTVQLVDKTSPFGQEFSRGGMDVNDQYVFAASYDNACKVWVCEHDFDPCMAWYEPAPGQCDGQGGPEGLAIDKSNGNILIMDTYHTKRVHRVDQNKVPWDNDPIAIYDTPSDYLWKDIATDLQGNIFLVGGPMVYRFDPDMVQSGSINLWEEGIIETNSMWGIDTDNKGNVYVATYRDHSIVKLTNDLEYVATYGTGGEHEILTNGPIGVDVDDEGFVYVTEYLGNRVFKFHPATGMTEKIWTFGEYDVSGDDDEHLAGPYKARKYGENTIFITDRGNTRILKLQETGQTMKCCNSMNDILLDGACFQTCADGTPVGSCVSDTSPYYCNEEAVIGESCSHCNHCPAGEMCSDFDICVPEQDGLRDQLYFKKCVDEHIAYCLAMTDVNIKDTAILTYSTSYLDPFFCGYMSANQGHCYDKVQAFIDGELPVWLEQESGVAEYVLDIQFINENEGWAVSDSDQGATTGTILRTVNGGRTWMQKDTGEPYDLYGVDFVNSNRGWAVGYGDTIVRSDDGGNTWVSKSYATPDYHWYMVDFLDENVGFVSGSGPGIDGSIIIKTTDGGDGWNKVCCSQLGQYYNVWDISCADTDKCWAVMRGWPPNEGLVVHTSDGGSTWAVQSINTNELRAIYFVDENNGWAVGSEWGPPYEELILHTTNGGSTWTQQYLPGGNLYLNDVFAVSPTHAWIVGYNGWLFETTDGGDTWVEIDLEDMYPGVHGMFHWHGVYFLDDETGWVGGTGGEVAARR